MTGSAREEKRLLRARMRTVGDPGTRDDASAAVARRLLRLPELAGVRSVLGYAATADELSVDDALEHLLARGVTVCLPWVDGDRLGVAAVAALDTGLAPGWHGLREPVDRSGQIRPALLDAVIAPGLGFDPAGNRLGRGGGHFDRLIGQLRRGVPVIGVALDEQVVASIPTEHHDRRVDVVVTPTRTLRRAGL